MRVIKFRVFNTKDKEMITHFKGARIDYALRYWELNKHVSEPMQFTGLKDKNGVDIYEGDIVEEIRLLSSGPSHSNLEVKYLAPSFRVGYLSLCSYMGITWKVIGNIHENPELIGG